MGQGERVVSFTDAEQNTCVLMVMVWYCQAETGVIHIFVNVQVYF
jgi:hypothetical protein